MTHKPRLYGKIALISGAAQGIGEAVARCFASHGAQVIVTDIQREAGEALAKELGGGAEFHTLNVCDDAAWDALVTDLTARLGGIDLLVNNAGGAFFNGPIEAEPPKAHRATIDLGVTGVWLGCRAVTAAMVARGGGSIINISSIDGLSGVPNLSSYVAAKFAVTGITRSLAMELGGRGIRVNSVHPGVIATPLVLGMPEAPMTRLGKAIARQPLARMGRPDEVANAALFFASDESSYCTGSTLLVDGGHLAGPYRDP